MSRIQRVLTPLIIAIFLSLIILSPSLNLVPQKLIFTNFHDSQRLLELLLISLVLLHSILFFNHRSNITFNPVLCNTLYILIALTITSSYLALSPRHATVEISLFAGLSYLTLFIAHLCHKNNAQLIKHLTYVFWASIILCMVAFYVGYITATIFKTPVKWPAPLTGFSNIRSFNQYQLWSLGLITLPLLTFEFKRPQTRYWLHLGLTAWLVLLFFSASRGALLAWLVGILTTAIAYKKSAWPFIRLQFIHITTGFVSYKILFTLTPNLRTSALVTGSVIRDTTSDRIELWGNALNLIQNNPIFGVGPMHFAWYSKTYGHPHNSVLQLMAELGIPAALLIFSMTGYGLVCWLKKYNVDSIKTETKLNRNLAIVLFFTIIASAAYSLVDGVIVMPISQVMMFTFIGLMIGFYNNNHIIQVKKESASIPIFASVVLMTLIWSTFTEIRQGVANSERHFSIGYTAIGPRFWWEVK